MLAGIILEPLSRNLKFNVDGMTKSNVQACLMSFGLKMDGNLKVEVSVKCG